ncbi:MAG: hypothetical protein RR588_03110 [Solibacillus sp.]
MSFVEKMQAATHVIQDYNLQSIIDVRVGFDGTKIHLNDANEMNKFDNYDVIVRQSVEYRHELQATVNGVDVFVLTK